MRSVREAADGKFDLSVEEAVALVKANAKAKFDETIEIAVNLGVDTRHADQMVRGVIGLPNGTGKTVRVAVFARDAKADEAKAAGADIVGAEDLMEIVQGGKIEFDRCIATPDMMPKLAKLGRVLGPKGLMPSPKSGTVSTTLTETLSEFKKGKFEYKADKAGVVHVSFGKANFSKDQLVENLTSLYQSIEQNRPSGVKGKYFKSLFICASMGPSIQLDLNLIAEL